MSKEVLIVMSDEVYGILKSEMGIKKMCGNICGVTDEILMKIIATIETENDKLILEKK